jgi:AcrR family transcriptional regulator
MSLRELKRRRTREAIVDAAVRLIERDGYEQTTIADIAAAAEIGTRTFFGYFATKEEVLFPESDLRVRAAVREIEARGPGDGPAEVLLRALRRIGDDSDDLTGRLAALVGAFVGAITGALQALLDTAAPQDPADVQAAVERATDIALRPWLGNR